MNEVVLRIKRTTLRAIRQSVRWYVAAKPRRRDLEGADRRVLIVLMSAWGMGGTIRAAHNMAGWLAANGYEVEILSIFRLREKPFFEGGFPPGVKVTALDDHRKYGTPAVLRPLRSLLTRYSSSLAHPADRHGEWWNLWVDFRLARKLRRRTGFLVTTRPSLNLMAADLKPPGLIKVGLEQINLGTWSRRLRRAIGRRYDELDILVALTEGDVQAYRQLLDGRLRLARIPNTVHDLDGGDPDLGRPVALAAGRLTRQKGFDFLIPAWAPVARAHPEWKLRICGKGDQKAELLDLIREHGLEDSVELAGPAANMGAEFANASIFVLSSRYEGFPLILIEAMSKGLGVVSFDCPTGPSDIIDDHQNGLLVRPHKDIEALSAALEQMVGDDELRRRCGAAAAETAREFTIDAVGPMWDELLQDLAQQHRS
jgi:glycosyltransferase involved in cell wall biosynthesis